jgi:hypothetical protein
MRSGANRDRVSNDCGARTPRLRRVAVVTEELTNTMPRSQPSLTWNMLLESGGVMISKEIELEIHLELVLTTPSDRPDPTRTASTPQRPGYRLSETSSPSRVSLPGLRIA